MISFAPMRYKGRYVEMARKIEKAREMEMRR
jgi:hypothetical protein